MVSVERVWPGSTLACLAPGPSLTAEDCEAVRGRMPVIAINEAIQLAPWADVVYSSDRAWWGRQRQALPSGRLYSIGKTIGAAEPYRRSPSIQVLTNTGQDGMESSPSGLKSGRNSGYAAVNLAVHLGATTVLLLGYNMSRVGGQSHFYHEPYHGHQSPYREFVACFHTMVEPLRAAGVTVINCTPKSALTMFRSCPLREAMAVAA